MSFAPVVPFGGFAGWAFLQRTLQGQKAAHSSSPEIVRDTDYFTRNIGQVRSASDLVSDRRLLKVALGAFGLDDDLDKRAFVERVLSDGVLNPDALANKLADKRYFALAKAFGFDLGVPNTALSTFPDEIVGLYRDRRFETAVGESDNTMRLALSLERELTAIATRSGTEDSRWYLVMGNPPLRTVFETALGLPSGFSSIDIDQQLEVFKSRTLGIFGDSGLSQFAAPEGREALVRRFLAMSQIGNTRPDINGAGTALQLLAAARGPVELRGRA